MDKVYEVVQLDDTIDWGEIETLKIDNYPWYESGAKEETEVALCVRAHDLYIHVTAQDEHKECIVHELNGPVCDDSCFEMFMSPVETKSDRYINMEINANGVLHMSVRERGYKKSITQREANNIQIKTIDMYKSVDGKKGWILDILIPLNFIEKFYGKHISSAQWQVNFYRCGGYVNPQYACWNDIDYKKPNFHLPKQFGKLKFI